jgi:hypothetical protein
LVPVKQEIVTLMLIRTVAIKGISR